MTDIEKWLLSILRPMINDPKRYGDLVVKVQAGNVVDVYEGKNHKPPKRKRRIVDNGK